MGQPLVAHDYNPSYSGSRDQEDHSSKPVWANSSRPYLEKPFTKVGVVHYTNINSKWIKDLNIRPQTLKLVQERVGNTLELIGRGKNFLNGTPAAQQLRDSIDKWDFIKLKSFCSKEMLSKLKRPPTECEKIFASYTSKD
jgi:hypothetical protein